MKNVFLLLALFILKTGFSQNTLDTSRSVVVHKDPRVDLLLSSQAATNAAIKKATTRSARGYRLLIVNTNKRDEAIDAKTKVYTHFPDLKAYLVYQSPYFKLKAGNFRTRDEAERYRKTMSAIFPKGVFIIADTIELQPEAESNQ